jgi:O-antigen/teichoic acid export membrane protein
MPADRPGRRPDSAPDRPYYFRDGRWEQGPPVTPGGGRHSAPTRAERLYAKDGGGTGQPPVGVESGGWGLEAGDLGLALQDRQMAGINALISIANFDNGLYDRQSAGISALITLANEVAVATRSSEVIVSSTGEIRKLSKLSVISKLRQDEMIWNSLYLIMSTGLQAATGFIFWIITAHLFSVSDVGKGSALITGAGFIGILSLVGLNNGIVRYLPETRNRDALVSSSLAVVAVVGALAASIYVLLTPFVAPELVFVEKSPVLAISFVLITSAAAVNTLTDGVFIASRKAKYTFFVDAVIGGFGKLAPVFLLTGAGAYGLFLASAMGTVLATVSSILLIVIAMRVRVDLREPLTTLKPLLRFSGANYIGNIMNVLSTLIIPIILLDRLGAESTGYFFVSLQMAQIVYTAALALEQTFLTEGSRADADMRQLRRRSLRLLVIFFVVAGGVLIGLGRWLLLAFGQPYYHFGYASLVILVLAAAPISANYWLQTVLRLAGKLRAVIVVNATSAIATCSFAWIGASHGLTAVAWGWLGGALLATCVAAVAARR